MHRKKFFILLSCLFLLSFLFSTYAEAFIARPKTDFRTLMRKKTSTLTATPTETTTVTPTETETPPSETPTSTSSPNVSGTPLPVSPTSTTTISPFPQTSSTQTPIPKKPPLTKEEKDRWKLILLIAVVCLLAGAAYVYYRFQKWLKKS